MKRLTIIGAMPKATKDLPDGVAHCVVTSPPYWNKRNYGGLMQVWGGAEGCEHEWGAERFKRNRWGLDKGVSKKQASNRGNAWEISQGQFCSCCGAWRGQLGLEPTPQLYVEHVVEVAREIWRLLQDDGVMWLNLGDTYASGKRSCKNPGGGSRSLGKRPKRYGAHPCDRGNAETLREAGLKPKDLALVPAEVALALRADGWVLRGLCPWVKPNAMPESAVDRPTVDFEYVFLFSKSNAPLFWTHREGRAQRERPVPEYRWVHADGREVEEEPADWRTSIVTCPACEGKVEVTVVGEYGDEELFAGGTYEYVERCPVCGDNDVVETEECGENGEKNARKDIKPGVGEVKEWVRVNLWRGHDYFWDREAVREPHQADTLRRYAYSFNAKTCTPGEAYPNEGRDKPWGPGSWPALSSAGRNMRATWIFPTTGCSDAHFAVFPPELPRRCILAGAPTEVCAECGAPYVRVVWRGDLRDAPQRENRNVEAKQFDGKGYGPGGTLAKVRDVTTIGFCPTCDCDAGTVPAVVLDPFAGRGTTGAVATALGRDYILVEAQSKYEPLIRKTLGAYMGEVVYVE